MSIWPFRRAKAEPAPPESNHDWRVGDLGECISAEWVHQWPDNPKAGDLVKVSELEFCIGVPGRWMGGLYLFLGNPHHSFHASCFRKIVVQHEPATAEFKASLRDRKPAPALEPVNDHRGIA